MATFLTVLHVLISIGLIFSVLLQSGKGGGLASTFGGAGAGGAVFGGRGAASFLVRSSVILASLFVLSCVAQSVWAVRQRTEVVRSGVQRELSRSAGSPGTSEAPGTPAPTGTSGK